MIPYSGIMVIVHGSKETPNLKKQGSARGRGEAVVTYTFFFKEGEK